MFVRHVRALLFQTMDLYMPPDEAGREVGEINMSFNRQDTTRRTGLSMRNPVYDNQYQ